MSRVTTIVIAPIALAALSLSLSGCGDQSKSTTASPASSVSESASASTSGSAPTAAAEGTLAASCSQIDAVMEASPDVDAAGTARKLEDIKTQVTTPDAELIGALAAAYQAVADNPDVSADQPEGQQLATTLSESATALGAACQSATTAPVPN